MFRMLRISLLLIATMPGSAASAADVQDWHFIGVEHPGTPAEAYVAEASVDDDTLRLLYFTGDDQVVLWFTYNGDVSFSQGHSHRAEFFMRTREGMDLSGRYDSDYVFSGKTIAQPDRNPSASQYVVATLTPADLEALRRYEGNGIIGVGYFIEGDLWRTYSLPSDGVWSAYQRLRSEARAYERMESAEQEGFELGWTFEAVGDGEEYFGWYEDPDIDISIALRPVDINSWLMTILIGTDAPRNIRDISIPVPGTSRVRSVRCGDAYNPATNLRHCSGTTPDSDLMAILLDDEDIEVMERAPFFMLATDGQGQVFHISLTGSAKTIASLRQQM